MAKFERVEYRRYSRDELVELAKHAAMLGLLGQRGFYTGVVNKQTHRWDEDEGLEIMTHHVPVEK